MKKVAQLARLQISPAEETMYQNQLSAIFKYFEEVSLINTDGIEPLVTPSEIEQVWREDKVVAIMNPEQSLANAPEKSGNLFRVPPVVG